MRTERTPFSLASGFGEYARFGAIFGFGHAVAEFTILGAYGVLLKLADVLLQLAIYPSFGAMCGTMLWAVLYSVFNAVPAHREHISHADTRWRYCFFPAMIFYGAVGIRQALDHSASGSGVIGSLVIVIVIIVAALSFATTIPTSRSLVLLLLSLSMTVYASALVSHELPVVDSGSQSQFLAAWAGIIGLSLLGIVLLRRSAFKSPQRRRPAAGILMTVSVLSIGCWLLIWPAPSPWQVRKAPPAPSRGIVDRERPNIILVVLDTLRADHMDLFGYERPTMPLLAEIVRKEFDIVETITATAPSSLPSHGSMFTGMHSSSHGGHYPFVDDPNPPPYAYSMRDDVPTLAEWLVQHGYRTVGISANFGVLSSYGLSRGFLDYDARPGPRFQTRHLSWLSSLQIGSESFESVVLRTALPETFSRRMTGFSPHEPPYRRAEEINERVTSWLDDNQGYPFFLFINYFDAHQPYVPVPELDQHFAPRPEHLSWIGFPYDHRAIARGDRSVGDEELEYLRGQYDAELVYLDRHFAHLIESLKIRDLYDDSLIIVVSDHGESFYEHGFLTHGVTLYEPELLVPLLIRLPKTFHVEPPDDLSHFQFIDIFPTITSLLKIKTPDSVQGISWATGRDYAMSENFCLFREVENLRRELFGVRVGSWKYIASTQGESEAFDLSQDPRESENIFGKYPEREDRARRIHKEHLSTYHQRSAASEGGDSALEKLRALGYVD